MCGLLAFFSSRGYAGLKAEAIAEALESLHHRGPDETGTRVVDEDVVFAHKRLAIIDVSSSHEPLPYADGRYLLTFNGEIYNYVELRRELIRDHGSKLDQGLSALIEDLDARGMLDDVTVIAWGEFGRTPRINKDAGRDHWPQVSCALLTGGGLKGGQVIGATNRLGEYAANRPVTFPEIHATLYHCLGINTASTTITDPTGRPQYVIEAEPLREVV